jgi:hypothetical protein
MTSKSPSPPHAPLTAQPAIPVKTAPPATVNAPDSPLADPAKRGVTLITPAFAPGSVSPLPKPTKSTGPNSVKGWANPKAKSPTPAKGPSVAKIRPASITRPPPMRGVYRLERKFPNMNPAEIDPMPIPKTAGVSPKASSPTFGAPPKKA